MITKWAIVVSDLDELNFFIVGPFDSKIEAEEFDDELFLCEAVTTIHPYIKAMNWIGNVRQKTTPRYFLESHDEYQEIEQLL